MANALTVVRLLLAAPVAGALARPELVSPTLLLVLLSPIFGTHLVVGCFAFAVVSFFFSTAPVCASSFVIALGL